MTSTHFEKNTLQEKSLPMNSFRNLWKFLELNKYIYKAFFFISSISKTFKYFPEFIVTIQNEVTQKELDEALYNEIRKLPVQKENLLTKSLKYSDLINNFLFFVEDDLVTRIKKKILDLKNKNLMEKSRIFQMIEIIRRVKTLEMAKFKFLINFGISLKNFELLTKDILMKNISEIPEILSGFSNDEIIPLYLYLILCSDLLNGKKIHKGSLYFIHWIIHLFKKKIRFLATF